MSDFYSALINQHMHVLPHSRIKVMFEMSVLDNRALPIFDMEALKSPLDVSLPAKPETPTFVCPRDWLQNVEGIIMAQLEAEDTSCGSIRVPPMAVVRCSRGGKTRALTEIAHILRKEKSDSDPIAVIFVSFTATTSLFNEEDVGPPLQALLRRISFAAWRGHQGNKSTFQEFHARGEYFDAKLFPQWLGKGRIVLIMDKLNNLSALTDEKRRSETRQFGEFLKYHFLAEKGRYPIFASHVLSTIDCVKEVIHPSKSSSREVILQELPLITNLNADLVHLKASGIFGASRVIYK